MGANDNDKKIINLFVEISKQGKSARTTSWFLLLFLLIAGIYGSIKLNILMLFLPIISFPLMRPYINPLHDKSVKKYLEKNKDAIDSRLSQKVSNLTKEQKLHHCKEALLIEIRSKLQKNNFLPAVNKENN